MLIVYNILSIKFNSIGKCSLVNILSFLNYIQSLAIYTYTPTFIVSLIQTHYYLGYLDIIEVLMYYVVKKFKKLIL